MTDGVEETNSGVRKKGDWKDVAEFSEKVEEAMQESEMDGDSVERFEEWRPKTREAENDMKKKTVNEAVVEKQRIEEETNGVRKDLKEAGEKVAKAGKKAGNGQAAEKELVDASEEAARPFLSTGIKFFRKFESMVYSWFSLRGHRFYLDTEEFSVDMKSKRGEYELDVNVPDERPRRKLKESLEDKE